MSIDIQDDYITNTGFALGNWVREVRQYWKEDRLTGKQIYLLENIGISKNGELQDWESVYCYAKNYYMDYGVLPQGKSFRTSEGIILGAWIERQKTFGYMLTDEQKTKLSVIGIEV